MPGSPPSRYAPDRAPSYRHRFHAGNVGDVWKHCVLVALLRAATGRVAYLDTHAGEPTYRLGATGEWTEGIGRLCDAATTDPLPTALGDYLPLVSPAVTGSPRRYPGSSTLARRLLHDGASIRLWDTDPEVAAALARDAAADGRVQVTGGDGLAGLPDAVATAAQATDTTIVLIDPPWTAKSDWTSIPDAVTATARRVPDARLCVWYPVKSLTRPNAMVARWRAAAVRGTTLELITTPLEHQRRRLNGSGVFLRGVTSGTIEALAAAASRIGRCCATHQQTWSLRIVSWG